MTRTWSNAPAYAEVVRIGIRSMLAYRTRFFFSALQIIVQIYVLRVVFTSVYAGQGSVDGITLRTTVVYLTLANLQGFFSSSFLDYFIRSRVREGKIASELARPAGFLGQMLALQIGSTLAMLPLLVVAFPLAWLVGGMSGPASAGYGALYAVSLALAYVIIVLLGLIMGISAFWTLETTGIAMIYSLVAQFFAGALVPLWFFPGPLRVVANLLPFQAMGFVPVSIYLGLPDGGNPLAALGLQCFWVVALYLFARWFWGRAHHRVVIQGG